MKNNELLIEFNDRTFRNIYEECLDVRKVEWTINLSGFTNTVLNAIEKEISLTDISFELNCEHPKEPSRDGKFVSVTQKAHDLFLRNSIECDIRDKYIYGFHSFSYEEFLCYIFWRTKIRENKIIDTPNAFLAMFLIEIVNFIEFNDYNDCLDNLLILKRHFCNDEHKVKMINTALEEFIILYGTECDYFNNCSASEFDYIFEADEIVNRTHSDVYNYVFQHTSGSFKKLSFYKKYKNCIGDDFESFFYSIIDYFNICGIDILNLWFGQKMLIYPIHFSYVKHKFSEKINEKNIIYRDNIIYSISKLSQKHLSRVPQDDDMNRGQSVFSRGYLMRYPLRLYENKKRKEFGMKLIEPEIALDDIMCLSENSPILTRILNIYRSDDFKKRFVDL